MNKSTVQDDKTEAKAAGADTGRDAEERLTGKDKKSLVKAVRLMRSQRRREAIRRDKGIIVWFFGQAFAYVTASVLAFAFVEFMNNRVLGYNPNYDPGNAVGMIAPMIVFLGIVNFYFTMVFFKRVTALSEGLHQVTNGEFGTLLNEKTGGPLSRVYVNFNKMSLELQNMEILKQDFIDNYSHEFKTPITSIKGFAELLLESDITEDERGAYLKIIHDEASRLAELASSAIFLSKLDTQAFIPGKVPYSLDEQLRQCAITLSHEWMKKNITLNGEFSPVQYTGNPDIMQHLWLNILGNAVKYTPDNGEITVNVSSDSSDITVSIADNGKGMTDAEKSRIFEKYYQGDMSRSAKGLGLGLSIAKRIVDLCNGEILVESAPGKGSTFTVILSKE